jgi:3-methyladenine DNA glycosylase Tag
MAIPEVVEPQGLSDYLAIASRAIFQAGLSWKMIEAKWDAYLRAFEGFDPVRVAAFGEGDVERILAEGGVVRTRKKIEGTIANARTLLELDRLPGGFKGYLRSFPSYLDLSRDLRSRFAFLGELSAYYFLFRVGEPVPRFEVWEKTVQGDHPRMREMIALARSQGRSPEREGA